jgi:hypothetical protein
MIRTAICFLALLFVVGSMLYLPTWVEHYRVNIAKVQR